MKKTLLLILSMVFCVTINAKVVLDFTSNTWGLPESSSTETTSGTYTNGTYSITIDTNGSNGAYYSSGNAVMIIGKTNATLTLPTMDFDVERIVIVGGSSASASVVQNIYVDDVAVSTQTTGAQGTMTYEIASDYQKAGTQYVLKITSNHNSQIATLTFYGIGEEDEEEPEPTGHGYEADDPYTCEEAIEIISALASGGTITNIYVKGIVSQIGSYNSSYGELIYFISDDGTTSNQLEIYDGYYLNNEKFTSDYANELMVGDEVIVYGTFVNYNGSTPEGSMGATYIYSLTRNGETPDTGGDTPTEHGYTPDDPYTASEAIAIAQELDSSTTISGVYVKGIISQINEISTSYGNATYFISDDGTTDNQLEIYRGYYLNGASFTSEDQIKVSDTVVVYGDLVDYYGNTPELTTGNKIYSINGSTEAPDTGGDGDEHSGEVEASGTTVTLTNPGVSVGTETTSIDFTTMGLSNSEDVDGREFTCDDGSTVTFAKGDGTTNPTYYTSGTAIRVYADNTITFTCNQCIAKIEMYTQSSSYDGNTTTETADFSEDGTTAVYCNLYTSNSGGTQLRVQSITIYYAGESEEEPEPEPEPDDGHTFNFEENTYGLTPTSNSSTYYTEDVKLEGNDGVTMEITVASGNGYRLWESTSYNDLRLYSGCVFTITAPNPMTEISFYCESSYVDHMSCDVGEYTVISTTGTWTGNATEVTFTMSGQMRLRTIDVTQEEATTASFTITSVGYATYYTDEEYTMPEGVVGTTITGIEDLADDGGYILDAAWEYEAGSTVPAQTALVLKGEEGTYTYTVTSTGAEAPEDNLLQGSSTEVLTTGPDSDFTGYYFYELTVGEYGVGFYWANDEGSAFTSEAHKAWLAMALTHPAKFIGFGEGSTTGISAVESSPATDAIYTIQGVRVSDMSQKGIYIVGGKKVLVK